MNFFRKILYPFSLIYGLITKLRNWAFDSGIIRIEEFDLPIIAVGNLNVGGTGKSPQIEYLIRLLQTKYDTAVLSRGYGRKTKGFLMADDDTDADQVGDEPLQFYRKFRNLCVAVDEKRVHGIEQIQKLKPGIKLILLDDAFQHRYVKAGIYMLLTAFDDLYINDVLLPAGNLRESKSGANRANIIVVTKCPKNLSKEDRVGIEKKLKPQPDQKLFFSTITYQKTVIGHQEEILVNDLKNYKVLLVTGIANPKPIEDFLHQKSIDFEHMKFGDHHRLENKEITAISKKYDKVSGSKKIILTTEKDYVRNFSHVDFQVYYLAIQTEFIDGEEEFNNLINDYVRKNKGNG